MATATKQLHSKPRKEKEKERSVQVISSANERLKTVIRRLPPNLPEDIFWGSVPSWVSEETVSWRIYYPGKASKRLGKENTPSRAYIAFRNEELLATFSREYDGHLFRDKSGNEFRAVVEFAPYDKVPSDRKKPDARNATIEKDEDYISFIEALNASKEKSESISLETLIASAQPPPAPTTTPLLEALKAEKSAAKDREAILRNHPHYKDIASRKADTKKQTANQVTAPIEAPSGNKKKRGGPPKQTGPPPNMQGAASGTKPAPGQSKPNLAGSSTSASPAKPPKPPKYRGKQTPSTDVVSTASPSQDAVADKPPGHTAASAGPSQPQPSNAASQPPTAPRRMRLGIASRQFEAALSGVGVSRKRDKDDAAIEVAKERPDETISSKLPRDDAQPPTPVTPTTPRSPRRDRRRKEGGAGAGDATPKPSSLANAPGEVRVPGILQRIDSPQVTTNDLMSNMAARIDAAPPPPNFGPPPPPHRGGPRGRGRGRGRGGPPRGG